jgi:hypothetical protein
VFQLEDRTLLDGTLDPNGTAAGAVANPGDTAVFQVTIDQPGRLTVHTHADDGSLDTRTKLIGPGDSFLAQSDAASVTNPDDLIVQHVDPGDYFVVVGGIAGGTGSYTVTTTFQPAADPFVPIPVGTDPRGSVTADFNRDGTPDVAVANSSDNTVSILLGLGDATFAEPSDADGNPVRPAVGTGPVALAAGDFNGDGVPDLAVVDSGTNDSQVGDQGQGDVAILLGNGDGTFQPALSLGPLAGPDAIVAGDFNRDGIPDLAVTSAGDSTLTVFLGRGDGTFAPQPSLPTGATPTGVAAADFNGDGIPDLAVTNRDDNTVSIFLGAGDGTFTPAGTFAVGQTPSALVAGDFNGDGRPDLAVADADLDLNTGNPTFRGDVSVLAGNGDGTFQDAVSYPVGYAPLGIVAGDFNGDGHLDLATANHDSSDLSVLPGTGTGTFGRALTATTESSPFSAVAGDFNGDGRLDLVTAESGPDGVVTVLVGRGNGTFQDRAPTDTAGNPVGSAPAAVAVGDFNGDGLPDLVIANAGSNDLSVLLAAGDGTFHPQVRVAVGASPSAVAVGDFNGDGRLDLAVTVPAFDDNGNPAGGRVAIFLGNGDGTFARTTDPDTGTALSYGVGRDPVALVADDFNGDGVPDLAVADAELAGDPSDPQPVGPGHVSVLLGDGHGGFGPATAWAVGTGDGPFNPVGLVTGDFNGDGRVDIATADHGSDTVSLLLGQGDGTFLSPATVAVGSQPGPLAVADFTGDGRLDLAVGNQGSDDVSVLLGNGDGTFRPQVRYDLNDTPFALVAADFTGDGVPDLAAADGPSGNDRVLLGSGDGTFGPVTADGGVGGSAFALAAADFNGDGLTDLANVNHFPDGVTAVLATLDHGDLFFAPPNPAAGQRATPLLVDVNGDGRPDSVVVSQSGRVLVRLARGDRPGDFAPPVVVNPDRPARAVTAVRAGPRVLLAATDQRGDGVALYAIDPESGKPVPGATFEIPGASLLARVVAGDLTGRFAGFDDLAVLYTLNNRQRVSVFASDGQGGFDPDGLQVDLDGNGPADLALADVTGHADGVRDILVADAISGDVNVLVNNGTGEDFSVHDVFRAGTGLDGVNLDFDVGQSSEGTVGVVAGDFNGDGTLDLLAADAGSDSLALLPGRGNGSFANPVRIPLGFSPTAVVAGRFDENDSLDLAVLDGASGQVHVLLGDGAGGFTEKSQLDPLTGLPGPLVVGGGVTGLAVVRLRPDGPDDLQVGNGFGDVLTLLGNGDGTFEPPARVGGRVPLVTTDLNGDGIPDAILANQSADQVVSAVRQPGTKAFAPGGFVQDRRDGLIGPGAIQLADLNGDGVPDLVVANSGANSVLVYLGQPGGGFGPPRTFFVGTNPVGLTVKDLNGDGVPDLAVANEGSDDVSILFGRGNGTFRAGGRFRAGDGPLAADFRDVNGDGIPDLVVTNGQDGTVSALPGVGAGFYNDTGPTTVNVPGNPVLVADNQGYLVTAEGAVILSDPFDPGKAAFTTVFTSDPSRQVTFAEPFLFPGALEPALFVARSDGSVSLLTAGPGEPYTETQVFHDPALADPSALATVPLAARDELDVYATDPAGEVPVVFTLSLGLPVVVIPVVLPAGELTSSLGEAVTGTLQPLPSSTVPIVPVLVTDTPDAALLSAAAVFARAEAAAELEVSAFEEAVAPGEKAAEGGEVEAVGSLLTLAGGDDQAGLAGEGGGADPAAAAAAFLDAVKGRARQDPPPSPEELLTPPGGAPDDRPADPLTPDLPEEKPPAAPGPRAVPPPDARQGRADVPEAGPGLAPAERDVAAALADSLPYWWAKGGHGPSPGWPGAAGTREEGPAAAEVLAAALLLAGAPGLHPDHGRRGGRCLSPEGAGRR